MKNRALLFFIIFTFFTSYIKCITLIEYIQQNGIPTVIDNELNLSDKNLTDINGLENIPSIEQLTQLNLSNNKLTTLPSGIFDTSPNLYSINLSNNQLQALPSDIFNSLPQLCILDISHNQLKTLPHTIFHGSLLFGLDLSNNQLKILPTDIFNGLCLLSLNLGNNQLEQLPETVFNGLDKLYDLYLNDNQLKELPSTIFTHLPHLQYLNLKGNPFSKDFIRSGQLDNILCTLRTLTQLDGILLTTIKKETLLKSSRYIYKGLKEVLAEQIAKKHITLDHYQLRHCPLDIQNLIEQARERLTIDKQIAYYQTISNSLHS